MNSDEITENFDTLRAKLMLWVRTCEHPVEENVMTMASQEFGIPENLIKLIVIENRKSMKSRENHQTSFQGENLRKMAELSEKIFETESQISSLRRRTTELWVKFRASELA